MFRPLDFITAAKGFDAMMEGLYDYDPNALEEDKERNYEILRRTIAHSAYYGTYGFALQIAESAGFESRKWRDYRNASGQDLFGVHEILWDWYEVSAKMPFRNVARVNALKKLRIDADYKYDNAFKTTPRMIFELADATVQWVSEWDDARLAP